MVDLHIASANYRVVRKPDLFRQADILARISPLAASGFGEFLPLFAMLREQGVDGLGNIATDHFGKILTPVARELAKMSDSDRRFIIGACLEMIDRREDGKEGWARIWDADIGRSMFSDIQNDITVAIRLCVLAMQETFGSFLPASVSDLARGKAVG